MSTQTPVNLVDIEARAFERLPRETADYFAGGAEDEVTLRANREAFDSLLLRPRYLVDVSERDLRTTVLGTPVEFPVLLAPTGFQALAHHDGEIATARAAHRAGTIMTLSTFSTFSLEDVQRATPGPKWFQLYVHKDRGLTRSLVARAHMAGYQALVLTVDVPVLGRRERDIRNGFVLPPTLRVANFEFSAGEGMYETDEDTGLAQFHRGLREPAFTWKEVDWLASLSPLPILLKGVLRGDDAAIALDHGIKGIIVSNHGGRQLDGVPASLSMLPGVVDAVNGRIEVLMDGGIRRGSDIVKALCLGARAVLIGRAYGYGLAAGGHAGVARAIDILRTDMIRTMKLLGCPSVHQLGREFIG